MAGSLSLKNFTRRQVPRFAYEKVARAALPGWEVSLVFAGRARAQNLNRTLRRKEYVPNVLSYAAGAKHGEIVICLSEARRQAPRYGMAEGPFVLYLFIHGLLHLKGHAHSATMERSEQALLARFAKVRLHTPSHVPTHHDRHRHRHLPGKAGSR